MKVWTALMASSMRLACSRMPASTSISSRSLRSAGTGRERAREPRQGDAVAVAEIGDERVAAALAQAVVEPLDVLVAARLAVVEAALVRNAAGWRCRSRSRRATRALGSSAAHRSGRAP